MIICFIGPQGSGKSTQAQLLAKSFGLHHIEMGGLVREHLTDPTQKSRILNDIVVKKGKLLPDGVVLNLLIDKLDQFHWDKVVLDGFPRTLNQYHALLDLLSSRHQELTACIYFKVAESEAVRRMQERGRVDDNPQAIAARLEEYQRVTQPMIDEVAEHGKLITVETTESIQTAQQSVVDALAEKLPPSIHATKAETRTLYIVAHCQSDYNEKGLFTGRLDIPLSQAGHERCELSAEILKNQPIDVAYRSSLARTGQTLEHILKYHPNIQVIIDDRFIERSNGDWDGQSKADHAQLTSDYTFIPPNGESMKQVEERVMPAFYEIVERMKKEKINVLLVSHDMAIRPIRAYFEKLNPEQMMMLNHQRHQIFTYQVEVK